MTHDRRVAAAAWPVVVTGLSRAARMLAALVWMLSVSASAFAQSPARPPAAGKPAAPATARTPAAAPPAAAPTAVTVTASVDRPAIWVADRLTYTIEIACAPGVDIVVGDLDRDKLKLTGLEVVSSDVRRREEGGRTRYSADYTLTTYRLDAATLTIDSFPVRYYLARAGQQPQDAAPAGAVTVPPVAVAFRSLLPDDQAIYDVRDQRTVPPRWLPYRLLGLVGLGLVLVSVIPAVLLLIRIVTGARARRRAAAPRSSRQTRQAARATLDEIRGADGSNVDGRRLGFARLDALVRQHVAGVCGLPAAGMTPDEIAAALPGCAGRMPIELVTSILAVCELARYGHPDLQPPVEAWEQAVRQAEQILGAR